MNRVWLLSVLFVFLVNFHGVIKSDTVLTGEVLLDGDVYVAPGVTLTVKDGAVLKFTPHSSKFAYFGKDFKSSGTREPKIIVAGTLELKGKKIGIRIGNPDKKGSYGWGGIYVVGNGKMIATAAKLSYGLNGIVGEGGEIRLVNVTLSDVSLVSLGFKKKSTGKLVSVRVKNARLTGLAVHDEASVEAVDVILEGLPKSSNLTIGVEVLDKGRAKVVEGEIRDFNYGFYLTDYSSVDAVNTTVSNSSRDKYPIGALVKDYGHLKCFKTVFRNCEIGVQIEGNGKYEGGMVSFLEVSEEVMR